MNPVELERRLQRIERALDDLASAGRPRIRMDTWTPDVYGGTTYGVTTYIVRQGQYLLINRVCLVWISLQWTSTTASGELRVSLPFASDSNWREPIIPMRHYFFSYTSGATLHAAIILGSNHIVVTQVVSSGSYTFINVPPSGYLGFAGMYRIAP